MEITDDIFDRAEQLLGEAISEDKKQVLAALCAAAASELESKLKRGVAINQIQELFVTAAGVLALSMYIQLDEPDGITSFSAGSVSVNKAASADSAASLRKQAETMLQGYLADQGFEFVGVRG